MSFSCARVVVQLHITSPVQRNSMVLLNLTAVFSATVLYLYIEDEHFGSGAAPNMRSSAVAFFCNQVDEGKT